MNLDQNPTPEQLRELLAGFRDRDGHHVLWVAKNGDVRLSRLPKNSPPVGFEQTVPDVQWRYETFVAGNGYVGPEAAADDEWVTRLFESLTQGWPAVKGKPGVEYADAF